MDLGTLILCASTLCLAVAGFLYGYRFIRIGNYLCGIEWVVMGTSSSNALVYFLTNSNISIHIAHFFDTFSRAFGVPIVIPIGMMVVTHGYKPSIKTDIGVFVVSTIATFAIMLIKPFQPIMPYFLLVMSVVYAIYLVYLSILLARIGNWFQVFAMSFVAVTASLIAGIYDFYKIPGDGTNIFFNFFTLAMLTWAIMVAEIYYAYQALERGAAQGGKFVKAATAAR